MAVTELHPIIDWRKDRTQDISRHFSSLVTAGHPLLQDLSTAIPHNLLIHTLAPPSQSPYSPAPPPPHQVNLSCSPHPILARTIAHIRQSQTHLDQLRREPPTLTRIR